MTASTHSATCHCGSVTLTATLPEGLSSATRCTCSFCRRRAAPAVTALTSTLKVTKGAEHLTLYTWGTHTAKHYFCRICGIYMYHQRRSDPAQCGVNLGCIDGAAPWTQEPIPYTDGINHPSDK
ncbi:GFA family protein [Sulfitobacter sp. TCYB15]|uniref:GFA family protein n=1 Tax=Sulfitobacter sp. TCYB15 TaxID=3229275 RepID=A0AAU8C249_9RHOB|nr:GFA family protein [Sulfitobacter pontiacus]OAN79107.1 aldehyde-activating protein [Sulfitobacter pontiacus]QLL43284.1 GFA family protein [Sulfitobacter pontiacus]